MEMELVNQALCMSGPDDWDGDADDADIAESNYPSPDPDSGE